ncbi:hypothetical protein ABK905_05745 [Acerihabitans sp. KWT182]|uniref:Uncharacterized protein n=1 Tax=Acerihabitans sp. KWT182 TaxID=3157919 RepID=A0AAU7QBP0_9GAMM
MDIDENVISDIAWLIGNSIIKKERDARVVIKAQMTMVMKENNNIPDILFLLELM